MNIPSQLIMKRCPQCNVANPSLIIQWNGIVPSFDGLKYQWAVYSCKTCGRCVMAGCAVVQEQFAWIYPSEQNVSEFIPDRARDYLQQAVDSLSAPSGAVMLACSALDAMLKVMGLKEGNLYSRIKKAAEQHLITTEMAAWAHDIRLDANDQRHADDESPLPNLDDALRCIEFARSLADFLFVLPAQVKRGRDSVIAKEKK